MSIAHHAKRINALRTALSQGQRSSCLVVGSAQTMYRSRDISFPYRQDSDFFYLTGSHTPRLVLVVTTKEKTPLLLAPPVNKQTVIWEGSPIESGAAIARRLGARLIVSANVEEELLKILKGCEVLYHPHLPGSAAQSVAARILLEPGFRRVTLPRAVVHSDVLLERMRMLKDPAEIEAIRVSGAITTDALTSVLSQFSEFKTEYEVQQAINYVFAMHHATPAFNTIVATGPAAAVLHYEQARRKIRKGEMVLIDCGAEHNMYAADISRVFPMGGRFSDQHREIYRTVLAAQKAAIKAVRPGATMKTVHEAAARVMTEGLVTMKVLKGRIPALMKKGAYKDYFMHGIGHSLGLDVHDIGKLRAIKEAVLEEGMVITIEPGLYFARKMRGIAPCGVRIEDDVVVTKRGCAILTDGCPKELDDIEALAG